MADANNTLIFPEIPALENGDTIVIESEWEVVDGQWKFIEVTDYEVDFIRWRDVDR